MDTFPQHGALSGGGEGGFSLEWPQRKAPQSKSKLEEFFPGENMDADDGNQQWLSMFVEECLSSSSTDYSAATIITNSTNYPAATPSTSSSSPTFSTTTSVPFLPSTPPSDAPTHHRQQPPKQQAADPRRRPYSPCDNTKQQTATPSTRPVRARKRRADLDDYYVYTDTTTTKDSDGGSSIFDDDDLDGAGDPDDGASYYPDAQLLHQTHWLADSELLVRPPHQDLSPSASQHQHPRGRKCSSSSSSTAPASAAATSSSAHPHAPATEPKVPLTPLRLPVVGLGLGGGGGRGECEDQQLRDRNRPAQEPTKRCTHCQSHKTPQWREGPMGPKTLCNACGVRFRSGRLLSEYRPARSPTFESCKHSNSHKKVLEMRMMNLQLSSTPRPPQRSR